MRRKINKSKQMLTSCAHTRKTCLILNDVYVHEYRKCISEYSIYIQYVHML